MYFFEGVKEKGFFGIFEKITFCFDLGPKSLYLFVSDSVELRSMELHAADSNVPEGKLNFFLKLRSSVLNFAFLFFVDRLEIFLFLYWMKRKSNFFYNDLGA